jgi:hypothetical protein
MDQSRESGIQCTHALGNAQLIAVNVSLVPSQPLIHVINGAPQAKQVVLRVKVVFLCETLARHLH